MVRQEKQFYEFGVFRVDKTERLLLRDGQVVPLTPKVFDTLLVLVENSGHILTKEEVMNQVWGDTVVEEANLTKNVSTLRKALGEKPDQYQFIETIPWRGYRFMADVREVGGRDTDLVVEEHTSTSILIEREPDAVRPVPAKSDINSRSTWKIVVTALAACAAIGITAAATIIFSTGGGEAPPTATIPRTIAVLPFRMLDPEAGDQYLGLGIADSIIAKTSQIKGLTVRPTSAVRKYVQTDLDVLAAAREQKVETVLDGTIQQSGERLRVSVNLLNVSDGSSLWAETFDLTFKDIFKMQDEVSRQIAERLRLKLSDAEAARIARLNSSNPEAYRYFVKAMYHVGNINANLSSRPEADLAVDLFKKAVEVDPNYALAHAQLGYTYTKIAVFLEENPAWIELAKQELAAAERLNPELADVHAARYFIAFSQYEGWQVETAFRELQLAQELDPNAAHLELGDLYAHVGAEEKAVEEYETALKIDPNSDFIKEAYIAVTYQANLPDAAFELSRRFYNRPPTGQYFLEKMMPLEAEPLLEQELKRNPEHDPTRMGRILLLSLQGRHEEAQTAATTFLKTVRKNRGYHHYAYNTARIFAQGGNSEEAVKWLRFTAENGFPSYPLFERDRYLDPIRKTPEFGRFLAEMKERWESYVRSSG